MFIDASSLKCSTAYNMILLEFITSIDCRGERASGARLHPSVLLNLTHGMRLRGEQSLNSSHGNPTTSKSTDASVVCFFSYCFFVQRTLYSICRSLRSGLRSARSRACLGWFMVVPL